MFLFDKSTNCELYYDGPKWVKRDRDGNLCLTENFIADRGVAVNVPCAPQTPTFEKLWASDCKDVEGWMRKRGQVVNFRSGESLIYCTDTIDVRGTRYRCPDLPFRMNTTNSCAVGDGVLGY